jgi:hypothetical protein
MKKILLSLGAAWVALNASAALYTTNWSTGWDNGTVVPDNNYSGWTDTRTISGQSGTINSLAVNLNLSGGWNGDLYAYLVNNTGGYAVLLDRPGYVNSGYGYGDPGFNITLGATGNPIESYQAYSPSYNGNGQLLGNFQWQSNPTAFVDPNGTWTLFIADLNAGDMTTVLEWGLAMDIAAVPEPATLAGMMFGAGLGVLWLARSIPARRRLNQWKAAFDHWLDAA